MPSCKVWTPIVLFTFKHPGPSTTPSFCPFSHISQWKISFHFGLNRLPQPFPMTAGRGLSSSLRLPEVYDQFCGAMLLPSCLRGHALEQQPLFTLHPVLITSFPQGKAGQSYPSQGVCHVLIFFKDNISGSWANEAGNGFCGWLNAEMTWQLSSVAMSRNYLPRQRDFTWQERFDQESICEPWFWEQWAVRNATQDILGPGAESTKGTRRNHHGF